MKQVSLERHHSINSFNLIESLLDVIKTENNYDSAKDDSLDEDEQKLVIKEEETESHDEEEQKQNISQASSCDYSLSQFKDEAKQEDTSIREEEESDEDMPLVN